MNVNISHGDSSVDRLISVIQSIAPKNVFASACFISEIITDKTLMGNEQFLASSFVLKRRQEFAAGRLAARQALQKSGLSPNEIPIGLDGAPVWQEGYVGSISHSGDLAVAITGKGGDYLGIGIDIERRGVLDLNLTNLISCKDNCERIDPTLLFSIKESGFKCISAFCPRKIDFIEAKVEVDWYLQNFIIRPTLGKSDLFPQVKGIFISVQGFWCTVSYLKRNINNEN